MLGSLILRTSSFVEVPILGLSRKAIYEYISNLEVLLNSMWNLRQN